MKKKGEHLAAPGTAMRRSPTTPSGSIGARWADEWSPAFGQRARNRDYLVYAAAVIEASLAESPLQVFVLAMDQTPEDR